MVSRYMRRHYALVFALAVVAVYTIMTGSTITAWFVAGVVLLILANMVACRIAQARKDDHRDSNLVP